MKNLCVLFIACVSVFALSSCEEDEGELPEIAFKSGSSYVSSDSEVDASSKITIGIEAEKSEEKDPLISFNISKSVNGGSNTTIHNSDLSGDDQEKFEYDFDYTVGEASGDKVKLTFTVTNRDGLQGQTSLTLTVK